jgi:hypothetical protein
MDYCISNSETNRCNDLIMTETLYDILHVKPNATRDQSAYQPNEAASSLYIY